MLVVGGPSSSLASQHRAQCTLVRGCDIQLVGDASSRAATEPPPIPRMTATPAGNNTAKGYYEILDTPQTTNSEEIKRAYHRKALLYHPDKNPGHEAELLEVRKAYDVLGNPAARRIYDEYGELGVTTLEMVKSPLLVEVLLNTTRLKSFYIVLYISLLFVACFPFLVTFKIKGSLGWSWLAVFSPLALLGVMMLLLGASLLFLSWKAISAQQTNETANYDEPEEASLDNINKSAFVVATTILAVLIGSFLYIESLWALRLDGTISISFWAIAAPYLLLESFHLLWIMLSLATIKSRWSLAKDELLSPFQQTFKLPFLYLAYISMRWSLSRLSFVVLLILKCSGRRFPGSWMVVFLPVYLGLLTSIVVDYVVDRGDALLAMEAYNFEQGPPPTLMLKIKFTLYGLLVGLLCVSATLLNLHLSFGTPGWGVVFAPLYVVSTILFLVIAVGGLLLYKSIPDFSSRTPNATEGLTEIVVDGQRRAAIASELEWLRRFGYILGPFQHRLRGRIN